MDDWVAVVPATNSACAAAWQTPQAGWCRRASLSWGAESLIKCPSPSSKSASLSELILQDLSWHFLHQAVAETKAIPSPPVAPDAFLAPCVLWQPLHVLRMRSVLRCKDGLQCLKKGSCSSLLGNYFTRRGTGLDYSRLGVWWCSECLLPCLPSMRAPWWWQRQPFAAWHASGVSSIHCPVPLATVVPGCPIPLEGVSEAVVAHVVSVVLCLLACWVAVMCLEPKSAPTGGV